MGEATLSAVAPLDLLIAAVALANDLPLWTRNASDFETLGGLIPGGHASPVAVTSPLHRPPWSCARGTGHLSDFVTFLSTGSPARC
jgi:hypothetical protein